MALLLLLGRVAAQEDPEAVTRAAEEVADTEQPASAADFLPPTVPAGEATARPVVYVIPIQGQISQPTLFVLRRGLKDAIAAGAGHVVLDIDTPGGRADITLEIMEALERFPGQTAAFINHEAISAGALIASVADDIYFTPTGVMGAAELVMGTGADVPEAMKRKMTSYINAKVRALATSDPRRADVLKAMTSPEFEFVLDEKVISPKGELLMLTANEAMEEFGDPPRPLLARGIVRSMDDLLAERFPGEVPTRVELELTWSERVAQWLTALAPVLLGLGLLGLFIEFKTPGFGIFGILGGGLMLIVFFGHYVAGLSGHEPALLFALGMVLVAIELLVIPGTVVVGLAGVILMLGSLVWSMADLWPNEPVEFTGELFARPLANLGVGLAVAVVGAVALVRFLPRGWFWDRLVLGSAIGQSSHTVDDLAAGGEATTLPGVIGREGVAVSNLYPGGQIEIDGRRYEAQLEVGYAEAGTKVIVKGQGPFGLLVERSDQTS
jgi:membrane-bound serine protease (ClpP class)